MAVRPSWEGHLRLSLVTCPVALYPATSEAESIRFNLINPETNNRIKMKTVDAGTGEEVSRADLVKGFAVAKDQYVLLDKEDLDAVKLESTRIIDIEEFVTEEKKKGKPVRAVRPANDDGKVVDLMDALKKSLKGSGTSRERAERFTEAKTKNGKKPGARRRAA
jgi:non-homologous end joining protein Ku